MKYVSLMIVLILMAWTWSMSRSDADSGFQVNREMEDQVEVIVTDYVRATRPTLKDIRFQQLFTETVHPNEEMRVHLRYVVTDTTATGDIADQGFQGILVLKSADHGKTWRMVGQDIQSPIVEFRNGTRISTKNESETTLSPAGEETPAPTHEEH